MSANGTAASASTIAATAVAVSIRSVGRRSALRPQPRRRAKRISRCAIRFTLMSFTSPAVASDDTRLVRDQRAERGHLVAEQAAGGRDRWVHQTALEGL